MNAEEIFDAKGELEPVDPTDLTKDEIDAIFAATSE